MLVVDDSGFSNLALCLLVRPWNTSGAVDCQMPEFSSRVVKEGGCCNLNFGYLHSMLIPRFVLVARSGERTSQFCCKGCVGLVLILCSCVGWLMC